MEAERWLTYGMLDRAEALYRRVAEEDPRDAEAVLGLARVASERGDDERAYQLAVEASRIDPRNTYASALAVRLRDILAAQGRAVPASPVPAPHEPERSSGRGRLVDRLLRR